jgi:signal transduction histidine kinase
MDFAQRRPERVMIVERDASSTRMLQGALTKAMPDSVVTTTDSFLDCIENLSDEEFDIVVLDDELPHIPTDNLSAFFKVYDYEPEVLLISRCSDSQSLKRIAEARKRYIVRDELWIESTVQAVRDMVRIRRLEHENATIRARLTEANVLLEERTRRLDNFCSTIAHDIRGPLAGLILKMEYILKSFGGQFDDRCKGMLNRSVESAERLVGIVQAMYEFAKVGSIVEKCQEIDAQRMVEEVVHDLHIPGFSSCRYDDGLYVYESIGNPGEEPRQVRMRIQSLPMLWGNAGLLRRIFINLISNAVKFADKRTTDITIGYNGEVRRALGTFAELYVSDNGPGMPAWEVASLFQMFSRGSASHRGSEGLGVGMAVVQRIVDLHYGTISVKTDEGEGTTFTFLLPRSEIRL